LSLKYDKRGTLMIYGEVTLIIRVKNDAID
jgi:hypothetical protein